MIYLTSYNVSRFVSGIKARDESRSWGQIPHMQYLAYFKQGRGVRSYTDDDKILEDKSK